MVEIVDLTLRQEVQQFTPGYKNVVELPAD